MPDKQETKLPPMDPILRDIFAVVYRFRQKYQHPVNTDEFWCAAAAEMSALAQRFDNNLLALDLLIACYTDIERELKGQAHE